VFWGSEFGACSVIIRILAVTLPFVIFANVIRTQYLLPKGMDTAYIKSVVIGAVVNLILNGVLIAKYGANGASVATVCAEISVCISQSWNVRNKLPLTRYVLNSLPFAVFGIVMWMGVYKVSMSISQNLVGLMIEVALGGAIYVVFAIVYLIATKDEIFAEKLKKALCR
jgi:O-antigen/teichoic acid export membrane protein